MKKILEEAPLGTLGRTWRSRGPNGGRQKHLHAAGQQQQTEYERQGTCSLVFTLNHNHPPDPRKMHFLNLSMWKSLVRYKQAFILSCIELLKQERTHKF